MSDLFTAQKQKNRGAKRIVRSRRVVPARETKRTKDLRTLDYLAMQDPCKWLKLLTKMILSTAKRINRREGLGANIIKKIWKQSAVKCGYYLEIPLEGDCGDLADPNTTAYKLSRLLSRAATTIGKQWGVYMWASKWMQGYGCANQFRWFHGVRKLVATDGYETGSEKDAHTTPRYISGTVEGRQDQHEDLSGSKKYKRPSCEATTDWYLRLVGAPRNATGGYDHGHKGQELVYIRLYLLIAQDSENVFTAWVNRRSRILAKKWGET